MPSSYDSMIFWNLGSWGSFAWFATSYQELPLIPYPSLSFPLLVTIHTASDSESLSFGSSPAHQEMQALVLVWKKREAGKILGILRPQGNSWTEDNLLLAKEQDSEDRVLLNQCTGVACCSPHTGFPVIYINIF